MLNSFEMQRIQTRRLPSMVVNKQHLLEPSNAGKYSCVQMIPMKQQSEQLVAVL